MDVLADVLRRAYARDGAFARSVLTPPWGLRFVDSAPLVVEVVLRGSAWLLPDQAEPLELNAGDLAIVAGGGPYTLADDPGTSPGAVIHGPGLVRAAGEPAHLAADRWRLPEPRSYGDSPDGPTLVVRSAYQVRGSVSRRLLDALPPALRVPAERLPEPARALLDGELRRDEPGQQTVLDRLLDLLLVLGLRAWFADPAANPPAWYRAQDDPQIGQAIRLMHAEPARAWTVAGLAAQVGLSRAAFARRFGDRVGEPPMSYLTRWRIDLAADLLTEPDATVASVARQVGYSDGFALSAAFKRVTGAAPRNTA